MDKREMVAAFCTAAGIQNIQLQQDILQCAKIRWVKKGDKLFEQGHEITKVALKFTGGIARLFYVTEDGSEITDCFDNAAVSSLTPEFTLGHACISNVTIEALCDFPIIEISMKDLQMLVQKHPKIAETITNLWYHATMFRMELKRILSESTAEEKVIWFNNRFPTLTGRVPEKHIASYLNMSPVTLSRIRTKLRESSTP